MVTEERKSRQPIYFNIPRIGGLRVVVREKGYRPVDPFRLIVGRDPVYTTYLVVARVLPIRHDVPTFFNPYLMYTI